LSTTQSNPIKETRLNRTAWLAMLASVIIIMASLMATAYRFSLPTDGWELVESPSGELIFLRNYLAENGGQGTPGGANLQPEDTLLAVEGQPIELLNYHLNPGKNWRIGGSLNYTIERGGETLNLMVPLMRIPGHFVWEAILNNLFGLAGVLLSSLLGVFVFSRRPGDPAAQVLLFLGAVNLAMSIASQLVLDAPAFMGRPFWVGLWIFFFTWVWGAFLFPSLLLLALVFPRPKRFVQRYPILVLVVLYGLLHILRLIFGDQWQIGWGLVAVFGLLALTSLVHSYINLRHDPVALAQTKWVLGALVIMVGYPALHNVLLLAFPSQFALLMSLPGVEFLSELLFSLLPVLLPVALAIAILRYRLFDIDVIIRRTLVYGLLTILLGVVYLGGVTVLQSLFTATSGQSSPLSIVLSTLAIAALFSPLRRRIQDFIDRRFYRQKYNAEQALAEFATAARAETDLDELVHQLAAVVQANIQPEHTAVWLCPPLKHTKEIL
jgi:hypothetical protein